jgi:hypothetical protein
MKLSLVGMSLDEEATFISEEATFISDEAMFISDEATFISEEAKRPPSERTELALVATRPSPEAKFVAPVTKRAAGRGKSLSSPTMRPSLVRKSVGDAGKRAGPNVPPSSSSPCIVQVAKMRGCFFRRMSISGAAGAAHLRRECRTEGLAAGRGAAGRDDELRRRSRVRGRVPVLPYRGRGAAEPHGPHKLQGEILAFVEKHHVPGEAIRARALATLIRKTFSVEVHPRTIERALTGKKLRRERRPRGHRARGESDRRVRDATNCRPW